jgi:DNA invertase Pin-like site-specific DNA recombinase
MPSRRERVGDDSNQVAGASRVGEEECPMQGDTLRRKRVALYARVSTPEQVRGDNIAAQLTALEAAVPRGADIVERYADEGFSGTVPFEARPEGRRLLEDARRGAFDSVYARHLDRLGRSVRNLLDLANDLVEHRASSSSPSLERWRSSSWP